MQDVCPMDLRSRQPVVVNLQEHSEFLFPSMPVSLLNNASFSNTYIVIHFKFFQNYCWLTYKNVSARGNRESSPRLLLQRIMLRFPVEKSRGCDKKVYLCSNYSLQVCLLGYKVLDKTRRKVIWIIY